MVKNKPLIGVIIVILVIVLIIGIGILAGSSQRIDYYQMGFFISKSTGAVDTSEVNFGGLYFKGPDYGVKLYPRSAQFQRLSGVRIFTKDRLEISLWVEFQYFLRPRQLVYLHDKFDLFYKPVIENNALDALKGRSVAFTTREFFRERDTVEKALKASVQSRLGGRCCEFGCRESIVPCVPLCKPYDECRSEDFGLFTEVRFFQLKGITLPSKLREHFLRPQILREETERSQLQQEAIVIRKQTDQQAKVIENEAREISSDAQANATLATQQARAEASLARENARIEGLKYMYTEANVTSAKQQAAFDYLRTLRRSEKTRLVMDFQTYVAGNLK